MRTRADGRYGYGLDTQLFVGVAQTVVERVSDSLSQCWRVTSVLVSRWTRGMDDVTHRRVHVTCRRVYYLRVPEHRCKRTFRKNFLKTFKNFNNKR